MFTNTNKIKKQFVIFLLQYLVLIQDINDA